MIEGSGIDIVEIDRVKQAHQKWGESFLKKVFTEKELNYSFEKRYPYQHLAARFAAKEATLKAFGNGWEKFVSLNLIEVLNDPDGKPQIQLNGDFKKLYKDRELGKIIITMSHSKKFAVASCILVKNG